MLKCSISSKDGENIPFLKHSISALWLLLGNLNHIKLEYMFYTEFDWHACLKIKYSYIFWNFMDNEENGCAKLQEKNKKKLQNLIKCMLHYYQGLNILKYLLSPIYCITNFVPGAYRALEKSPANRANICCRQNQYFYGS